MDQRNGIPAPAPILPDKMDAHAENEEHAPREVLHQKQVDSPVVKQVSVRRFATFDLFTRSRVVPSCPSDDQWVQYRSVSLPEYSALLRDNLGPLRVNEVLNSFDNTGNVCKIASVPTMGGERYSDLRFTPELVVPGLITS
ncbi:unnamed protein product [Arctogadus glacialis]